MQGLPVRRHLTELIRNFTIQGLNSWLWQEGQRGSIHGAATELETINNKIIKSALSKANLWSKFWLNDI